MGSVTDLRTRYPEFLAVSDASIELAFKDASSQMSKKVWGNLYDQGLCALAAHLLYANGALTKSGSNKGKPVQIATSKSAGALSVSYSAHDSGFSSNHKGYANSSYGQRYLELRDLVGVYMMVC